MKYRDYKQFAAGNYYHIFNRGNNKQDIFKDEADYALFLARLKENLFPESQKTFLKKASSAAPTRKTLPAEAFSLTCYCLMPNHFHLLLRQNAELPLSKLLSKVCTGYAKCFNLKYERIGQVFQDQFKAIEIDTNEYLVWLSAYIHSNPFVARYTKNIEDWRWSSYGEYLGKEWGTICDTDVIREQFESAKEYSKFVLESVELIRERKNMEHILLD